MQCPGCTQELADETRCESCQWEAISPSVAGIPEAHPDAAASFDSTQPVAEATPQAADSFPPPPPAETVSPAREEPSILPPTKRSTQIFDGCRIIADKIVIAGIDEDIGPAEALGKSEDEKPLPEFIKSLPLRTSRDYRTHQENLTAFVDQLRENRLVLITCSFEEYAMDAAYDVIEALGTAGPKQTGLLSYAAIQGKNVEFSLGKLLEQKIEGEDDRVLLVDASNTLARTFPASILGNLAWAASLKDDLKNSRHFLVVIVDLDYASQSDLKRQHFPYREVPFLGPFLEMHFPDQGSQLEAQITEQRQAGRWEKNDVEFAKQVLSYHHSDKLLAVVGNGGPKDPTVAAESLLAESGEVEKTVLYTAAFFQEITSPEFCRVVEALLAARTARLESQANDRNRTDGGTDAASLETPLLRHWEESKDDIFTDLLIETYTGTDSVRGVSLSESNLRDPLRRLFEKKHRFYLIDQFKAIQECGIFFYPSLRLAENTTQIAVEMARLYPDEFNEAWIVSLIIRLREHFSADQPAAPENRDAMFHFLNPSQPGALNLAFARVSDFCRRLLESTAQKSVVQNSLEHLMKLGYHEEVLWLVRQLRFSQDFDDLYWIKQLLYRADNKTRNRTYNYLHSYLKRLGNGVYEGLTKIEKWLPRTDRGPETYSKFDYFVFRLLIQYCLEAVGRFDAKDYGKWPSRHPLFAFDDLDEVSTRISLLTRWLLHPGIEITLDKLEMGGTQMSLIGALLAEWSFILLGPNGETLSSEPLHDNAADSVDTSKHPGVALFRRLFNDLASHTDSTQRLGLLKYWNSLSFDLLRFLGSLPPNNRLRQELSWKRKLVCQLLSQIKKAPRRAKAIGEPSQTVLLPAASMTIGE